MSFCRTRVFIVIVSHLNITFRGSLLGAERRSAASGARLVAASMISGLRTGYWSFKTAHITEKTKFLAFMRHHIGICDKLSNALKLLTHQQKDGDSPVEESVTGLFVGERSRSIIMDRIRKFIEVDKDLHRGTRSKKVVNPKFATVLSGKARMSSFCLRAHEECVLRIFIDTSKVGNQRWWLPQADADWHAFGQAMFQGVERTRVGSLVLSLQGSAPSCEQQEIGENKKGKIVVGHERSQGQRERL